MIAMRPTIQTMRDYMRTCHIRTNLEARARQSVSLDVSLAIFEVAMFALECSVCNSGGTACRSGKLCRGSDRKLILSLPLAELPPMTCDVARQVSNGCATQAGCASMCHPEQR